MILIVEDNPINLELVSDILDAQGYKVFRATSGAEAMEIVKRVHPDMILMDIQLPGLDGLEITRMIKKDPQTKDIIVVALTAHVMKGDRERILEAGCSGYIPKPINSRDLPKEVAKYLPLDPPSENGKG
jgi:CheY-like chemotaxis protein